MVFWPSHIQLSILCYAGDVFYARWEDVLVGATAVVSTLGGFGNEEQMKRINGEANTIAVDAAKEFGEYFAMTNDSDKIICMHFRKFCWCGSSYLYASRATAVVSTLQ